MESDNNSFDVVIRAHYEAVAANGLDVWIGAEPTFTNRQSPPPEWLSKALGETRQVFACRIIKECATVIPVRLSCASSDVSTRVNHSRAEAWVCTCVVTAARWPMFCRSAR